MRKHQQKQILELLVTLREAAEELKLLFQHGQRDAAAQLLADCQNGAVHIGEFIEEVEGGGTKTVALLEEYCDLLYQASNMENVDKSGNAAVKKLKRSLSDIENSVRAELEPNRIEVAFFPYKASMWDSLESIWLAAREDPACDAYVVPIPYYEKLGGACEQIHYEGDQYPADVPITSWRDYDVQARHPDVIYIHNPYDDGNYVTHVHPDFYSSRLKFCTDLLVYVPYFVASGKKLAPEFALASGVRNADMVIVQSELVRQNYLRILREQEKTAGDGNKKTKLEDKILALGSPKFDKVRNTRRDMRSLPEEWRSLIERPGGGIRKIVFYNTAINALLKGNEQYLAKLRLTLSIFRKRDDVVLWWRPHPLLTATVRAMRPDLLQEYAQIVSEYRREGWGIYDDTADLYRAIAWSDAYYGDRSSLDILFSAAEKPVMVQSLASARLIFENLTYTKGAYWFTAYRRNALFKMDSRLGHAEWMGSFPAEKNNTRLFFGVAQYKNKLVFSPLAAESICVYCVDTGTFVSIPVEAPAASPPPTRPYLSAAKFAFCAVHDQYAFLFPSTYPAIAKLNLETYEIEYLYEPMKEIAQMVRRDFFYFRQGAVEGDIVRLWCIAAGALAEFDMSTGRMTLRYLLKNDDLYMQAVYDGSCHWLVPVTLGAKILKLSADFEIVAALDVPPEIAAGARPFGHAVVAGKYVWLLPGTAHHALKIDAETNRIEIAHAFDVDTDAGDACSETKWKYLFSQRERDCIYAYNRPAQKLAVYDWMADRMETQAIVPAAGTEERLEILTDLLKAQYARIERDDDLYLAETPWATLPLFLDSLLQREAFWKTMVHTARKKLLEHGATGENVLCGQAIYDRCKQRSLGH